MPGNMRMASSLTGFLVLHRCDGRKCWLRFPDHSSILIACRNRIWIRVQKLFNLRRSIVCICVHCRRGMAHCAPPSYQQVFRRDWLVAFGPSRNRVCP